MAAQAKPANGVFAPYSQEAEEATLGACLTNPELLIVVRAFLHAEDFYILRNQYIFEAMSRQLARNELIDFITVQDELRALNRLDDIGGAAYLLRLVNSTPDSTHGEAYARLVERTARRRRYLVHGDEVKALAMDEELSTEKVTLEIDQRWMVAQRSSDAQVATIAGALDRHIERTEDLVQNPRKILGIPSAIADMSKLLKGYRPGKLYVPAGRPGMGKSTWLLTEAGAAAQNGLGVLFCTLEMPEDEVMDNLIAQRSEIPIDHIESGEFAAGEWRRYIDTTTQMGNWRMSICDQAGVTPLELRAMARKLYAQGALDILFVDYIQLMSGGRESRYDNRDQEIGYISRTLKGMAKELNIPVIAAAQLSRKVEDRMDKHPMLSDLRESGNIENDADVVMFFYRDDYYNKPAIPNVISPTEISVAKHRGGRTGMITAGFHGAIKRFVPLQRAEGV